MKVTKKTRLLKKPLPKVNLTSFDAHMSDDPDYAEFELGVENCEGVLDYQESSGVPSISVRVDLAGGGYEILTATVD